MQLASLVLALCLAHSSVGAAVPTEPAAKPEYTLIPGPGLPSLESLNLTVTDLLDPAFLSKRGLSVPEPPAGLTKRANCGRSLNPGTRDTAIVCANFLNALDTHPCQGGPNVIAGGNQFCTTSANGVPSQYWTRVFGRSINGVNGATSYCRDVASAVWWGINNCGYSFNGFDVVQSSAEAYGNGDLIVDTFGN